MNRKITVRPGHAASAWTIAAVLAGGGHALPARAQAFSGLKAALVDYSRSDLAPKKVCSDMAGYQGKDIRSIHAAEVPASATTAAHCRITGTLRPEIAFEVSLPAKWNGRFYMIGNGGHAGESLEDPMRVAQRNEALKLGFAFAQTNTGHDSRKEPGASFVLSNPQKAVDYAYRAVHATAVTGKDLTRRYYGRKVQRAYWNSCSNGGRQGLIEAQRYPEDFDGLYVTAPWVSQTGFSLGAIWNQQALDAATPLTGAKLALLADRVMAKCDASDGLQDRLISDPRRCSFDAATDVPACAAGTDDASCLTTAQAAAINKIYSGPVGNGKPLFPGFMPGSEAVVSGGFGSPAGANSAWLGTVVPAAAGAKAADFNLAEGTLRYLAHTPPKPDYDYRNFSFDRDAGLFDAWAAQVNATSTDLTTLKKRGGKILMTYGWADQILQPLMGIQYHEQVTARYGAATPDFLRLFMVPGMTHCSGGNGLDRFDAMTALINWVEKGKAPDSLAAAQARGGQVVRTRPLCPHPQVAKYSGTGSIDEAANFSCAAP
jgi:feruloyl esterase